MVTNTSILQLTSERDHLLLWSRRWMSRTHNSLMHEHGQWWLVNASKGLTCIKEPKCVTYNIAEFYMPHILSNVLKQWFRALKFMLNYIKFFIKNLSFHRLLKIPIIKPKAQNKFYFQLVRKPLVKYLVQWSANVL